MTGGTWCPSGLKRYAPDLNCAVGYAAKKTSNGNERPVVLSVTCEEIQATVAGNDIYVSLFVDLRAEM